MATTQYLIDSYAIGIKTVANHGQSEIISCYSAGVLKGFLSFYQEGVTIPASSMNSSGRMYLRFHASQFAATIETLKEESPILIWFNDTTAQGGVSTSSEPVGEEES